MVFYPGIKVKGKTGKFYMPPLIQKAVPGLFDSYVVVIPDEHTTSWDSVKSEYTEEIKKVGLEEIDLSIGIFSGSGNGNTSIQKSLNKLKLKNLFLMDPSGGNATAKYQKDNGANVYLMYNPNNWKDYPTIANNFTALAKIVGANSVNTQSKTYDHEDIPGKLLKKWITDIDKTLTRPALINESKPVDKNSPITPKETKDNKDGANTVVVKSEPTPPKYDLEIIVDGSESTDIVVNAKQNLPEITVFIGGRDPFEQIDQFEDLSDLDEEYIESAFRGEEENQQIALDLEIYSFQGDSEGTEDVDSTSSTPTETPTGGGVNTNGSNAGGTGIYRFQQKLTIRGRVVKNGEIPDDLLGKVEGIGCKLEKHAAIKFGELNKAFKAKFGKDFTISGPYRTFKVSNDIFDWDLYNRTGKARKKGTNGGVAAAKPGTSKHGWGQAIDLGGFGNGPGNKYFDWMEQNAKKYGWINPAWAKKPGAGYEPWHWEYIGSDLFAP